MEMEHIFFLYLPIFIALYVLTQHALHKFQNFPPTPFPSLPLIGHLYLLKKPLKQTLSKLSHKYGPVFFLWFGSRRVLVISSASAAEECFTKNDIIFANRPHLLVGKHLGYNYTSIVWGPYGDHWRNLRRISSIEVLSSHRLQKLSYIRVDEVKTLVHHFYRAYVEKSNQPLLIKPLFYDLMFNVMTRMIAGKKYYGENTSQSAEAKRFQEIVIETARLAGESNLADFMPILRRFMFSGIVKRYVALYKKRDELVQKWIDEFREMGSNESAGRREKSMIEILLSLHEAEPEYYTDEDIKSLMLSLLQAGVSTSVDTMEWATSLLLNSPQVLTKAQNEIDGRVGQSRLINETDVAELPYLRCIINETLRMHPVAPFLVPHESSEECTIAGFRIPRETMLLVNLNGIQNDPKIWADPEAFRPERFEGAKAGFTWMPFGSGRRGCPGEGLAIRIVGLTLGSLIQCFDWARVGKEMVDMTERSGLTAPKAQPLMAVCRPRASMVNFLSQITQV